MWKLRHWLHSSLPDSFFLSFFFFPSLVLLSLSLASRSSALRKSCSFLSPRIFPSPTTLSPRLGTLSPSVLAVPFSYLVCHFVRLRWTRVPSSPAPRTLQPQRLAPCSHFFAHMLFSSLSLSSPQDFPFVSPSPLRLRFLPSETRSCFPCCAVLVAINS